MVDCQTDSCSDFSFPSADDAATCKRPLAGTLTASPTRLGGDPSLTDLARFSSQLGYQPQIHNHTLTIDGMTLRDALAVNDRFGAQLIISCDLRRHPPVRFD
jgi:hypothetical protein